MDRELMGSIHGRSLADVQAEMHGHFGEVGRQWADWLTKHIPASTPVVLTMWDGLSRFDVHVCARTHVHVHVHMCVTYGVWRMAYGVWRMTYGV